MICMVLCFCFCLKKKEKVGLDTVKFFQLAFDSTYTGCCGVLAQLISSFFRRFFFSRSPLPIIIPETCRLFHPCVVSNGLSVNPKKQSDSFFAQAYFGKTIADIPEFYREGIFEKRGQFFNISYRIAKNAGVRRGVN